SKRLRLYYSGQSGLTMVREIACDRGDCTTNGGDLSTMWGLTNIGRAPGISDDGKVIAWVGQTPDGATVFACPDADTADCKTQVPVAAVNGLYSTPELGRDGL